MKLVKNSQFSMLIMIFTISCILMNHDCEMFVNTLNTIPISSVSGYDRCTSYPNIFLIVKGWTSQVSYSFKDLYRYFFFQGYLVSYIYFRHSAKLSQAPALAGLSLALFPVFPATQPDRNSKCIHFQSTQEAPFLYVFIIQPNLDYLADKLATSQSFRFTMASYMAISAISD